MSCSSQFGSQEAFLFLSRKSQLQTQQIVFLGIISWVAEDWQKIQSDSCFFVEVVYAEKMMLFLQENLYFFFSLDC